MKIWKADNDTKNNIILSTEDKEDYKVNDIIMDGHCLMDEWDPSLELYTYKKNVEYSDIIYWDAFIFVVNEKALNIFKKMVSDGIECLHFNLIDSDEKYVIVNPIDVVDCVDMEKSEYKVYKGNPNKIQYFQKVCLKKEAVQGKHFFRPARCDDFLFLCSDEFKKAIEDAGIKGMLFELFAEV